VAKPHFPDFILTRKLKAMMQREPAATRHSHSRLPPLLLALLFGAAALPLILGGDERGRGAQDQNGFHLPAIRHFAAQWPAFDFHDYSSATTPGYHLLGAGVEHFVSGEERVLRLASALLTVGLLVALAAAVGRSLPTWPAVAVGLPMVASLYVFSSGVWLLPDNIAWWGVLGIVLLGLRRRVDWKSYVGGGVLLLELVGVRQSNLWAAAVLWLGAWLGSDAEAPLWPDRPKQWGERGRRLAGMLLATLPAFVLVAGFWALWGGGTPPSFASEHRGGNPAMPALTLAVLGVYGLFFAGFLLPAAGRFTRGQWLAIAGAILLGFIVGVAPATSYSAAQGRVSGIWNAVPHLPIFGERSVLIVALAMLGAGWLAAWCCALRRRDRWVFLGAWVAFIAAQSANNMAWQRYVEPFVLMMLALAAARVHKDSPPTPPAPRWAAFGPALLAMGLAAVTVWSLR
jgi:hypothetical protein